MIKKIVLIAFLGSLVAPLSAAEVKENDIVKDQTTFETVKKPRGVIIKW